MNIAVMSLSIRLKIINKVQLVLWYRMAGLSPRQRVKVTEQPDGSLIFEAI